MVGAVSESRKAAMETKIEASLVLDGELSLSVIIGMQRGGTPPDCGALAALVDAVSVLPDFACCSVSMTLTIPVDESFEDTDWTSVPYNQIVTAMRDR